MDHDRGNTSPRNRRLKKIALIAAIGFALYLVVGFWVVPPLIKPRLEAQITDRLGRKTTIDKVALNPLVLSATVSALTIQEVDGQPFAGFDELYANVQLSSIFNWALTVREIRLLNPFAVLKLLPDEKLNIDDILARLNAPKPEPAAKGELPRAIIQRFQVIDGKAVFEDRSETEPVREEMTPITFTVENLSTLAGRQGEYGFVGVGPKGAQFKVDGNMTIDPIRIQGHYAVTGIPLSHYWAHIRDIVAFQIIGGTTALSGDYTVALVDGRIDARLTNGTVALDDFKLVEKGHDDVLIALPTLAVNGIGADLAAREIEVESIRMADGRVKSWLAADGTFSLTHLLRPDLGQPDEPGDADASRPRPAAYPPWQVTLHRVELTQWEASLEDRALAQPAELVADEIQATVENASTRQGTQAKLKVGMRINRSGRADVEGTASITPLQADVQVKTAKIALNAFQPYVNEAVNATIVGGTTGSEGRIRYMGEDAQPQITYTGGMRVDDVVIQDPAGTDDFITQKQFKADGIALELLPNQLKVADVLIDRPHASIAIDKAGDVNVVRAFAHGGEKTAGKQQNLLQRLVDFLILQFKGPMPMQVDRIRQKNFTADFADASVSPTFTSHVEFTDGTVEGLSSDPSARAKFRLEGSIDNSAALAIAGQMNPMNALQYGRLDVSLKQFGLPSVSPYAGKYIGYTIAKGTLRTNLKYTVDHDKVDGDNTIIIDQLTLGESVDSPDALSLPIKLGVALLKDGNGRIALHVPVVGNVKDPRFDFTQTLISALTGSVKDAGSAPFAAVPEIDGFKGEELRTLAFEFGASTLQPRDTRKLDALAKFLKEKTALIVGVTGIADRQMDAAAILAAAPDDAAAKPETAPADAASEPDQADNGAGTAASAPAATVDDAQLKQLALSRAERVRAYLTGTAGIDAGRIRQEPIRIRSEAGSNANLVELSLAVD